MATEQPILEVRHLKKYFPTSAGLLYAVDDVNFTIQKGQTLGIVGESGCGKSTLGRTILRLHDATDGEILFNGKDILKYNEHEMKQLRSEMQMIFQDPYSSLNPRMTVGQLIEMPLKLQKIYKPSQKEELRKRVLELMDLVGLAKRLINSYPHELDGGRRQRIGIARALAPRPSLIVCDEPVSALDVSIQAQVLNLLQDLQEELNLTYIFITHDLSVVKHLSQNIGVMYLGQMVETAPSAELFQNPMHPYTKALLSAIPMPDPRQPIQRVVLRGELSSPINVGPGCRFAKRCLYAEESCHTAQMELREMAPNHFVQCIKAGK